MKRRKKSKKKKKVNKRTECGKCVRNCSVLSEMQAGPESFLLPWASIMAIDDRPSLPCRIGT
jgi:hypothetical protein